MDGVVVAGLQKGLLLALATLLMCTGVSAKALNTHITVTKVFLVRVSPVEVH